jgi:hypothetical protein
MKQLIDQYNELNDNTTKLLNKAYKKLEGAELDQTISSIYLDASKDAKVIIESLLKESTDASLKEEVKEIIEDLGDILQDRDLEYVFEDSEYQFAQLTTLVAPTNN